MELEKLWHLQEADLAITTLTEEIENNPLRQEVEDSKEKLAQNREEQAGEAEVLKEQRKRLKSLELDLQKNASSQEALRKQLYGGEVSNVRELEQMEKKLSILEKAQQVREEETLELMELIEEGDLRMRELSRKTADEEDLLRSKEEQLKADLERLGEELARTREEREALSARIEPRMMEKYQGLYRRHQGRGLARMVNNTCTGCSVFISSAQRGFLYNPQAMVYCESCGRLLVRLPEAGDEAGKT